ncbi:MAG: hypothetical protein ACK5LC_06030 [Coprobacillaceae bacterium]
MEYGIIWILFFAGIAFLASLLLRKMGGVRKMQKQYQADYYEKQERFRNFTSEKFDEVPTNELVHAVLHHIKAKEDRIYEGDTIEDTDLFNELTEGERIIYTICQVEMSTEGGKGSVHSFFINDMYKPYIPYVEKAFQAVNCYEIVDLMKSATRLAQIIEEDLEDEENDIQGDYASYNFSDYTHELLSLLKSSGILEKAGKYIRDNKEMFIEPEEISEEIGSEEDGEGTSDEI